MEEHKKVYKVSRPCSNEESSIELKLFYTCQFLCNFRLLNFNFEDLYCIILLTFQIAKHKNWKIFTKLLERDLKIKRILFGKIQKYPI